MRKLLLIVMLAMPMLGFGQEIQLPIDTISNKITYSEVVDISGTKQQLYSKGLEWFTTYFKSAKNVIQVQSETDGKILAKYVIKLDGSASVIDVRLSMYFKEGRYKFVFTDLFFDGINAKWDLQYEVSAWKITKGAQRLIRKTANDEILNAIKDLKESMVKKSESDF